MESPMFSLNDISTRWPGAHAAWIRQDELEGIITDADEKIFFEAKSGDGWNTVTLFVRAEPDVTGQWSPAMKAWLF